MKIILLITLLILASCSSKKSDPLIVDCENPDTKKWIFGQDHLGSPNVLSIGDSISLEYYQEIHKYTDYSVDVFHSACNGRYSENGSKLINDWLNNSPPLDAVIFNHGIWDSFMEVPLNDYKANLRIIVEAILTKTDKAYFITSTPHSIVPGGDRIQDYNDAALEVMAEYGVSVIDLRPLESVLVRHQRDGTHFTPYGTSLIANEIADVLDGVLF